MDPVLPNVIVLSEEVAAPVPRPPSNSPPPPRPHAWHPHSTESHDVHAQGGNEGNESAFARLVQTVRIIKQWTARTKQPDQRNQFLGRFKMAAPNIDDAFAQRESEGGSATEAGKEATVRVRKAFYFHPSGAWLFRWLFVITVVVLYNLFMIIVRETFDQLQSNFLPMWLVLDYLADAVYVLDMVVQFRTSYLEQGMLVTNSKQMALRYMKTIYFKLDVVCLFPFDLLYVIPAVGPNKPIVRILRILRLHRMLKFFNWMESMSNYPNLWRISALVLYITLSIHWNACFYFLLSGVIGFGSDSWVYPSMTSENGTENEFASLSRQYLYSFYWSTLTLTTIGEVPGPITDIEFVFVTLDFLVGVLIFATIVGMVGGIITNINIRRTEFQARLDTIKQYMRYRNVGKDLQARVIKWFDYLWTNNHTLDEREVLRSLPDKLKAEIAIHVHLETLLRVQIFEECEAGLLEELMLKLTPQVYSPGDYVCRKGDIGKEMYIIKHGRLEVVGDDGKTVLAVLTDGGYFGEISILNLEGTGNRRTANVRSVGYSDLFCLSKADLLEALKEYPETKAMLEERGRRTLMLDSARENSAKQNSTETLLLPPPTAQTAGAARPPPPPGSMSVDRKLEQLETDLEQLQRRFGRLLGEYNSSQMKLKQRIFALESKLRHQ